TLGPRDRCGMADDAPEFTGKPPQSVKRLVLVVSWREEIGASPRRNGTGPLDGSDASRPDEAMPRGAAQARSSNPPAAPAGSRSGGAARPKIEGAAHG